MYPRYCKIYLSFYKDIVESIYLSIGIFPRYRKIYLSIYRYFQDFVKSIYIQRYTILSFYLYIQDIIKSIYLSIDIFPRYCNIYQSTGCPTKHDSMQDDLNVVLIFDIMCCVYLST